MVATKRERIVPIEVWNFKISLINDKIQITTPYFRGRDVHVQAKNRIVQIVLKNSNHKGGYYDYIFYRNG